MPSPIPKREYQILPDIILCNNRVPGSPKIQRLVTPLRLQRRRHLLALKKRKLEHQKEQKAEYEYVQTLSSLFLILTCSPHSSVLIAKRVAEKKAKTAAIKASHHKSS